MPVSSARTWLIRCSPILPPGKSACSTIFPPAAASIWRSTPEDPRLKIIKLDLLDLKKAAPHFKGVDRVYHLAANPDARWGLENTRLDLEQETIVTYNVLEAMRRHRVTQIVLSSSGTVYGDVGTTVTHEKLGPALPISLYGAGKVAAEALVSAFCATFGLRGVILRFGNIVGDRTTHGAIYDFIKQLAKNSAELKVLGNGRQIETLHLRPRHRGRDCLWRETMRRTGSGEI